MSVVYLPHVFRGIYPNTICLYKRQIGKGEGENRNEGRGIGKKMAEGKFPLKKLIIHYGLDQ